jgi:hypothetical protein
MPAPGQVASLIEADKVYYQKKYGKENERWRYGLMSSGYGFIIKRGNIFLSPYADHNKPVKNLKEAYEKAQQAQFEFLNKNKNG